MYSIFVTVTKESGYSADRNLAVCTQVLQFNTREEADLAYSNLAYKSDYEVTKLYSELEQ